MITFLKRQANALSQLYQINKDLSLERNELLLAIQTQAEQIKTLTEENTRLKTLDHNKLIDYMVEQYTCKEIHTQNKEYKSHEVEVVE